MIPARRAPVWAWQLSWWLAVAWLAGCGGPDEGGGAARLLALQGRTMGTTYTVTLATPPRHLDFEALQRAIDAELALINSLMSTYDPDSELSRFNRFHATDWFPVADALALVADAAWQISVLSDGAFDATVGHLVNLWGFGAESGQRSFPSDAALAAAMALTGYEKLEVRCHPPALRKREPALVLDLSGIAKGYAVDRLAELLDQHGIGHYLVEIGGELRASGRHPERPWRVAIERPDARTREVFRVVDLQDIGMATSGDYRNFFERDGVLYSHTINPRTGRPVDHSLASVSVLDASAMRADALATALLVLGPDAGLAFAEKHDIQALFIERDAAGFQTRSSNNSSR